jgi:hypothetical protein
VLLVFASGCTCDGQPGAAGSDGGRLRVRIPGSKTELHQAPPIVFSAGRATGEARPTGAPLDETVAQRYVVELPSARQVTLTVERDGAFACEYTCPGAPVPGVIRGRAYLAVGGVALPGIGKSPEQPLVAPLSADGKLSLDAALFARSSNVPDLCR